MGVAEGCRCNPRSPLASAARERVAVLERIATDPAARTALEIEKLRSLARPSGSADK